MTKRLEAQVYGLVQGVFFRHFTQIQARQWGLVGTVTNQPDGSVHVMAEGPKADVERLLEWLQHGPELARVDRVDVCWSEPKKDRSGFLILR